MLILAIQDCIMYVLSSYVSICPVSVCSSSPGVTEASICPTLLFDKPIKYKRIQDDTIDYISLSFIINMFFFFLCQLLLALPLTFSQHQRFQIK